MVAHKLRQALGLLVIGFALTAAISVVSAQEGMFSTTATTQAVAESAVGSFSTKAAATPVTTAPTGSFSNEGGAAALASEDGPKVDVALAGDEVAVAQIPPASTTSAAAAAAQPALLNERDWSDGYKTVVECTGDVAPTCQANVYGPNGEFILGRTISPNGEAADCSGPCLDSTGAPLDASSVSRAQAASAAGSPTHKIIASPGVPPAPAAEEAPAEGEAEHLHVEGQ